MSGLRPVPSSSSVITALSGPDVRTPTKFLNPLGRAALWCHYVGSKRRAMYGLLACDRRLPCRHYP